MVPHPDRGLGAISLSMSREERRHIDNAIWLCSTHADMIDRDDVTFTADDLRAMKREHEDKIRAVQRNAIIAGVSTPDFIAIGPDIIITGGLSRHRQ